MKRSAFEALVAEALDRIPVRFKRAAQNVAVVVEAEPEPGLLDEMGIEPPETLFGLYQGVPLTERSWDHGNTLPDRIVLYQRPIQESCRTPDEVATVVAETLIHEFGHYFGLSEEEIEAIEARWWQHGGESR